MKILLAHNSYQRPGGEDVVFDQERGLLERAGHDVITYTRSNVEVNEFSGLNRIQLVPKTIWATDSRRDFVHLLDREKPDLVHVHNILVMISPSIFSACQEAGVPVVQTLHNYRLFCPAATFFRDGHLCQECTEHGLWRSIAHGCYRHSRIATTGVVLMLTYHSHRQTWTRDINCYIALSEFSRSKFVEGGLPANKVFVKPNFVYPDPGMRRKATGEYVLFVGRLSPEKRVSTLLEAWRLLRQPIPLIVIGGGPERATLEKEAGKQGVQCVTFRGHIPRDQILAAMAGARFLVFSSEWYENFPVTIAESFASGIPVLCSRLGAMAEIVDDGRTGLHFSPGNPSDLAEKVEWAWNNPSRLQTMGEEARREFESKYTAEKNYPILMSIYEHAMKNGQHSS